MQIHFSMPWAPQMCPPAAERSFIPGRARSVRWTPALSCFSCRARGCGRLAAAAHTGGGTGGSANTSTRGAAGHKKNHIYRATVSFNRLRVQSHRNRPETTSCASHRCCQEKHGYQHGFHSFAGTTKAEDSRLSRSSLPRQQHSRGGYDRREWWRGEAQHRARISAEEPRGGRGFSFLNVSLHARAAPLVPDTITACEATEGSESEGCTCSMEPPPLPPPVSRQGTPRAQHRGIRNQSSTVMRSGATCQQEGDLTCLSGKGRGLCSPPAIQSQLDPTS